MFIDIVIQSKNKGTITRVETFDLLDDRELDMYNDLLKSGITVKKRIHKSVPGIPGSESDSPTPPKLIEIVTFTRDV